MTKEDWLQHLEGLHPKGQAGIELGLERIRLVKAALGQTQHCPVITVGGTNGKGSTCAYLANIIDRLGASHEALDNAVSVLDGANTRLAGLAADVLTRRI